MLWTIFQFFGKIRETVSEIIIMDNAFGSMIFNFICLVLSASSYKKCVRIIKRYFHGNIENLRRGTT